MVLVKVHLYRPFSNKHLLEAIPKLQLKEYVYLIELKNQVQ